MAGREKSSNLRKQYPGTGYFDMILDKINTESSVANRAMMADYLDPKRFPWVFFADSFYLAVQQPARNRAQS